MTATLDAPTIQQDHEVSRANAEARLRDLAAMSQALSTRAARKIFWEDNESEIRDLFRIETHRGNAWAKEFLP